jgi:hypothetical protein
MLRKIAIGLAAAAIAMGGATLSASAMRGGIGPHGGGFARVGGFGPHHYHGGWRGRGGYYRYGGYRYGGSCWRDGVWVCGGGGYYGPSYYRYGYYRGGRGFRGGRAFAMRGGGRAFAMRGGGRRFR